MSDLLNQANELLARDGASAEDLFSMLREVQALAGELNSHLLPDPDSAMTLEQREKLKAEREDDLGKRRVVDNVNAALRNALAQARRAEAIAMADDNRKALESALKAAERAAAKAEQAKAEALAEIERLGKTKSYSGGFAGVGASEDQIERMFTLGAFPEGVTRMMLRHEYQAAE